MSGEHLTPIQTIARPRAQPILDHGEFTRAPADGELPAIVRKEPQSKSDQGCEPATTVTEGILVELDTEDWLINWYSEVKLLTQPHPESSISSLSESPSLLVLSSLKTVSLNYMDITLPPLIPSSFSVSPSPQSSATPPAPPQLYACSSLPSFVTSHDVVKPQVVHSPAAPK